MSRKRKQSNKYKGIYGIIKNCEHNYRYSTVPILDDIDYSQSKTIEQIDKYFASHFLNGNNTDESRVFMNIVKPAVRNAEKNLDYDTKDLVIKSTKNTKLAYIKAKLVRLSVQKWVKEIKLGEKINRMKNWLPKYGTIVVKKLNSDEIFSICPLTNLFVDPTVETIKNSWVIDLHYFTPNQILAKKGEWDSDAIDNLMKNHARHGKENYVISDSTRTNNTVGNDLYIKVYEFSGWVEASVLDGEFEEGLKYVHLLAVMPEYSGSISNAELEGITLFKEVKDKEQDLYRDHHYEKTPGRHLGVGVVEDLFDVQQVKNKQVNLLLKAQELANLILFATDNKQITGNILTDLENGDIVKFRGRLARINTSIQNIAGYQLLNTEIQRVGNDLANMFEVTQGSSLPAGTPFSLGSLLNQNANKFFDQKSEEFGLFLESIFNDWVLPELKKKLNKKHLLEILDQGEIEELMELIVEDRSWKAVKEAALAGVPLTSDMIQQIRETIKSQMLKDGVLNVEIPKDFFSDILDSIQLAFTGESLNKGVKTRDLMTILQMVSQNPALLENKTFAELLDWSGLTVHDVKTEMGIGESEINMNDMSKMLQQPTPNQVIEQQKV